MNLEIATLNGRLDPEFRRYVVQRLQAGLLRFERRIVGAVVSFLDLSGPYGPEHQCRLSVSLASGTKISIERRGASSRLALGRAVETVLRELRRRFEATGESGRSEA